MIFQNFKACLRVVKAGVRSTGLRSCGHSQNAEVLSIEPLAKEVASVLMRLPPS